MREFFNYVTRLRPTGLSTDMHKLGSARSTDVARGRSTHLGLSTDISVTHATTEGIKRLTARLSGRSTDNRVRMNVGPNLVLF